MSPYTIPIFDPLAWIDVVLLGWFVVTLASVAYIGWDVFTATPENTVILNMGPVALTLYVLADKEPRPGRSRPSSPSPTSTTWPPSGDWPC